MFVSYYHVLYFGPGISCFIHSDPKLFHLTPPFAVCSMPLPSFHIAIDDEYALVNCSSFVTFVTFVIHLVNYTPSMKESDHT